MATLFQKASTSTLDYTMDWSAWLTGSEVIASSEWTYPDGITIDSDSFTNTTAVANISGGTDGEVYLIKNKITTDSTPAKVDTRTFNIYIAER